MSRPEQAAPPQFYYNEREAGKYHFNSRVQQIQAEMSVRALDLLALEGPSMVLDVGSGSGLSGEVLSEDGHVWVGMDISADMLAVAIDRESEGDMLLADMGNGVPFRPGTFDAVISISAIQWLCNADTSEAEPRHRLRRFFETLYSSLKRGGKVVCQFYPMSEKQTDMILSAAKTAGFGGGLVVDNPDSKKAKKYYLALTAGPTSTNMNLQDVEMPSTTTSASHNTSTAQKGSKDWILRKKQRMRSQGKVVKHDSKFTGRKRKTKF